MPSYARNEWTFKELKADPRVPSQPVRELAGEMSYGGGETVFDHYIREPRL